MIRASLGLLLLLALGSCLGPPPSHALVVSNLEGKCTLVAFSFCAALEAPEPLKPPEPLEGDEQARFDEDAGVD